MHSIKCKCGIIRGHIEGVGTSSRVICYCTDCRAFVNFLGQTADVIDSQGGTEIVQIAQPRLHISQGLEHLACLRLSPNGMLRWYASCCNTPLGNTMANPNIAFIGLIHSSLDRSRIDNDFGTSIAKLNTNTALGEKKPQQRGLAGVMFRFFWLVVSTRVSGRYKKSPLFNTSGAPIALARVLTVEERAYFKDIHV